LVIVTTPEPGSFDGTHDLVKFAIDLRKEVPSSPFTTVLVINNCRPWEHESKSVLQAFYQQEGDGGLDGVVKIEALDSVRLLLNGYQIGNAAQNKDLWAAVKQIALDLGRSEPAEQDAAVEEEAHEEPAKTVLPQPRLEVVEPEAPSERQVELAGPSDTM